MAFLIAAGIVYEIIAFACSSPQTAEININKREGTLMKWVHLGQALAFVSIMVAAYIDPKHKTAIYAGGFFAMISAEAFYLYARKSGKENPGASTEQSYR